MVSSRLGGFPFKVDAVLGDSDSIFLEKWG